jgi:hypothetical protein
MTCSTAEKASWTTDASSPPALARLAPRPPAPPARAARAAWQIGHHWHSGGSLGGTSLVAVSHTSPLSRRSAPIVRFTWPATWFAMLRAPAFISQRWKSATGSLSLDAPRPLPDWLRLPDWPLALVWLLLLLLLLLVLLCGEPLLLRGGLLLGDGPLVSGWPSLGDSDT